ncbi:MAG: HNH endonuclease signature motif containing protein, partial [Blastococcus sp.]
CRFPGCGQPAARADLDHCIAYADGGPTDCDNLCCLCRRHHRLKTFATGWRFVLTDHGVLRVPTPSGITRSTRPPGMHELTDLPALPAPPGPPAWARAAVDALPPPADRPPF